MPPERFAAFFQAETEDPANRDAGWNDPSGIPIQESPFADVEFGRDLLSLKVVGRGLCGPLWIGTISVHARSVASIWRSHKSLLIMELGIL